jgi:hypothetical protein
MIAKLQTIDVPHNIEKKEEIAPRASIIDLIKDPKLAVDENNPYHKPDKKEKLKVISNHLK